MHTGTEQWRTTPAEGDVLPRDVPKAIAAGYDDVVVRNQNWPEEVLTRTSGAGSAAFPSWVMPGTA